MEKCTTYRNQSLSSFNKKYINIQGNCMIEFCNKWAAITYALGADEDRIRKFLYSLLDISEEDVKKVLEDDFTKRNKRTIEIYHFKFPMYIPPKEEFLAILAAGNQKRFAADVKAAIAFVTPNSTFSDISWYITPTYDKGIHQEKMLNEFKHITVDKLAYGHYDELRHILCFAQLKNLLYDRKHYWTRHFGFESEKIDAFHILSPDISEEEIIDIASTEAKAHVITFFDDAKEAANKLISTILGYNIKIDISRGCYVVLAGKLLNYKFQERNCLNISPDVTLFNNNRNIVALSQRRAVEMFLKSLQ